MIIDVHTHIYSAKELADYRRQGGDAVDKIITVPFFTVTKETDDLHDMAVTQAFVESVEGVYMLGAVDMGLELAPQLRTLREMFQKKSIVGIKLYPGYQHFYPSDERVGDIARLCGEFNRPLVFHSGQTHTPISGTLLKYSHPAMLDEVAKLHPNTNIVMSHFGFPHFLDAASALLNSPNLYADFSGIIWDEDHNDVALLIRQNTEDLQRIINILPEIQKKTMFGTDFMSGESELNLVEPYVALIRRLFKSQFYDDAMGGLAAKLYFGE